MSVSNGANVSCGIEVGSAKVLRYTLFYVLFYDMDVGSAAKIFCLAWNLCDSMLYIFSKTFDIAGFIGGSCIGKASHNE
ncbi:hypothetical protein Dimus_016252, partial [Dionaea muscipula]